MAARREVRSLMFGLSDMRENYLRNQKAQGLTPPKEVSLETLLPFGTLQPRFLPVLFSNEVWVSVSSESEKPPEVLIRVRLPGDVEVVGYRDGHVGY